MTLTDLIAQLLTERETAAARIVAIDAELDAARHQLGWRTGGTLTAIDPPALEDVSRRMLDRTGSADPPSVPARTSQDVDPEDLSEEEPQASEPGTELSSDSVVEALERLARPMTVQQLAEYMRRPKPRVYQALYRLTIRGRVTRSDHEGADATYELPAAVRTSSPSPEPQTPPLRAHDVAPAPVTSTNVVLTKRRCSACFKQFLAKPNPRTGAPNPWCDECQTEKDARPGSPRRAAGF